MASTILVREALWRVSSLLQDVSPQFTRWPETELVQWLNDAHLAIHKFLPAACSRVDAIRLKPGTRQSIESIAAADCLPGDGSTPAVAILGTQLIGLARNMGVNGSTPGDAIRIVDREVMDSQKPNWHTVTGASVRQFMYDPSTPRYFYVSPGVPAAPNVWVEAAYLAQPLSIPNTGTAGSELYLFSGANATRISVADEHIDDLVNYVCARAYLKNVDFAGNDTKASQHTALFTSSINAKVMALTGTNPNLKRLPLAPEPMGQAS